MGVKTGLFEGKKGVGKVKDFLVKLAKNTCKKPEGYV
jgi:hypothetical protein